MQRNKQRKELASKCSKNENTDPGKIQVIYVERWCLKKKKIGKGQVLRADDQPQRHGLFLYETNLCISKNKTTEWWCWNLEKDVIIQVEEYGVIH